MNVSRLNFKLVLAEPLEEDSDSHVQHFLGSILRDSVSAEF
jgi:hypothetical protein